MIHPDASWSVAADVANLLGGGGGISCSFAGFPTPQLKILKIVLALIILSKSHQIDDIGYNMVDWHALALVQPYA